MALSQGQVLNNRYRVVRLLGQGGFGAVYRSWDLNLQRPCAVKENLDTSPASVHQFSREAMLLSNLSHPNLPRVFDHFIIPAQGQYLVMDFIQGQDLQDLLAQSTGPLPEAQALTWVLQICDALSYLHTQNPPIIHRDIKPKNIIITPAGQAVLVDFGIAKEYASGVQTTMGARAVTPGYSPVEQYGQGRTDARTDIYALGATLYSLLTGATPDEATQRAVYDRLVPSNQLNPSVNPSTAAAIQRAMQINANARFQTAREFAAALRPATPVVPAQPAKEVVYTFAPGGAVVSPHVAPRYSAMKTCPYCANQINDEAIVCQYCKRDLRVPIQFAQDLGLKKAMSDASSALTMAILGIFCFGIILEPIAIIRARSAKKVIRPGNPGYGQAMAAEIIGWIFLTLWVLGVIINIIALGASASY